MNNLDYIQCEYDPDKKYCSGCKIEIGYDHAADCSVMDRIKNNDYLAFGMILADEEGPVFGPIEKIQLSRDVFHEKIKIDQQLSMHMDKECKFLILARSSGLLEYHQQAFWFGFNYTKNRNEYLQNPQ